MLLDIAAITHRGGHRTENQDGFIVGSLVQTEGSLSLQLDTHSGLFQTYGLLFAVADGMGGHSDGSLASRMTLETVALATFDLFPHCPTSKAAIESLRATLLRLHRELVSRGDLGSTLIGALFTPNYAFSVQLGDSRLYRFREGVLAELSQDQAVEMQTDQGLARQITSCLGGGRDALFQPVLDADLRWDAGDCFLLCSDGLTSCLNHIRVRDVLRETMETSTKGAVGALFDQALLAGAPDNITVVLIRCLEALSNG